MEEIMLGTETLTPTQQNILAYFNTHDLKYIAEDGVFRHMGTGETYKGRAEIGGMLHYFYYVAFNAHAESTNFIITEDKALVEGYFKGKHIGEFAGIKPTGKEVNVPMTVSYTLKNGLIQEGRIYMLIDVLLAQLGAAITAPQQKTTYISRDIFHLKYGHYREVKALMEEAAREGLMPGGKNQRLLTDFTGDAYRLIMEEGFDTLDEFEKTLNSELNKEKWQQWYGRFKEHVIEGHRELLKQMA